MVVRSIKEAHLVIQNVRVRVLVLWIYVVSAQLFGARCKYQTGPVVTFDLWRKRRARPTFSAKGACGL